MSENAPQDPHGQDDPQGQVSEELRAEIDEAMAPAEGAPEPQAGEAVPERQAGEAVPEPHADRIAALEATVAERTEDLQRLQAEYVNYKRRVDRDRQLSRQSGAEGVVTDLMPVLDSIHMAAQHDELTGGFKMVADEIAKVAAKHGLESYGAVGDEFDPRLHEALMQLPMPGVTVTTVSQVMQQGYTMNDRVLRPARVAVSDPDPAAAGQD